MKQQSVNSGQIETSSSDVRWARAVLAIMAIGMLIGASLGV
jgi:hypothetical protein